MLSHICGPVALFLSELQGVFSMRKDNCGREGSPKRKIPKLALINKVLSLFWCFLCGRR